MKQEIEEMEVNVNNQHNWRTINRTRCTSRQQTLWKNETTENKTINLDQQVEDTCNKYKKQWWKTVVKNWAIGGIPRTKNFI